MRAKTIVARISCVYRLLSGVRFTGFQVEPGVVVGGSVLLSGTAT